MKDVHETERFAPIEGFPDYQITSHGRVFSLKYGKMKELKQRKDRNGYMQVVLCKNGKKYGKSVHRLVAQAFIPNPDSKTDTNHVDENKSNNCVSNLEWMSHKENLNHGTRNERASKTLSDGRFKGSNHPYSKSVIGFKINGCDIKYYKYMRECEKDGFSQGNISSCCNGRLKSTKGYVWCYADEFFNRKDDDL